MIPFELACVGIVAGARGGSRLMLFSGLFNNIKFLSLLHIVFGLTYKQSLVLSFLCECSDPIFGCSVFDSLSGFSSSEEQLKCMFHFSETIFLTNLLLIRGTKPISIAVRLGTIKEACVNSASHFELK